MGRIEERIGNPGMIWRLGLIVLVVVAAMTAFYLGVEVSDRRGVGSASLLAKLYYTSGLFVLGGLDLGVPQGGSAAARGLLWFAYLGAPIITGLAVVEAFVKTVAPDRFRLGHLKDHLVVVGSGQVVEAYLERLHELGFAYPVLLLIPADAASPAIPRDLRVVVLVGDPRSDQTLDRLRLPKAKRVLLAMDDNFANLDAALRILGMREDLSNRVIVHVGDLSLFRSVERTRVGQECLIFNAHQIAARYLVHNHLLDWFAHTEEDDMVVLGGFGRFGQTVLSELQTIAAKRFDKVVLIDPDIERHAAAFADEVGFLDSEYERHLVPNDLSNPLVWVDLEERFALSTHEPAFVFGCSDDSINVQSALRVAETFPSARVSARVLRQSAFADELARDKGVEIIGVSRLVKESMPPSWFGQGKLSIEASQA